jgi:integrase
MATLPRGILEVRRKTKTGVTVKYRVRVTRKDCKEDRRFDDLEEAKEFLALTKSKKGKEIIYKITEEERQANLKRRLEENGYENFSFGHFVDLYIENNFSRTEEELKAETELQRRNRKNKLSFYNTICNANIVQSHIKTHVEYIALKDCDIRKLTNIEINSYIKERLKEVKAVSVSREITHISNIFNDLHQLTHDRETRLLSNPCKSYDRKLLKNRTVKREIPISPEEQERLFKLLSERDSKEMYNIARLSVLTSLRRSEIITLTWSQIKDNYIQLIFTKSGRPRKVYIDKTAQEFIASIPKQEGTDKIFSYSISGFGKMFYEWIRKNGFKDLRFHDLRRIAITNKVNEIGAGNSLFITEFLGMQSMKKFEDNYIDKQAQEPTTQAEQLKSIGHSYSQTTKIYYTIPNFNIKK